VHTCWTKAGHVSHPARTRLARTSIVNLAAVNREEINNSRMRRGSATPLYPTSRSRGSGTGGGVEGDIRAVVRARARVNVPNIRRGRVVGE
jgi:hypothetical protein